MPTEVEDIQTQQPDARKISTKARNAIFNLMSSMTYTLPDFDHFSPLRPLARFMKIWMKSFDPLYVVSHEDIMFDLPTEAEEEQTQQPDDKKSAMTANVGLHQNQEQVP